MKFEPQFLDEWTVRYRVYGGWLVNSFSGSFNEDIVKTSVFIPDPDGNWSTKEFDGEYLGY